MVFVNTGYFGTSIRNESVSSQDVATAQSPIRGAKYSQEKNQTSRDITMNCRTLKFKPPALKKVPGKKVNFLFYNLFLNHDLLDKHKLLKKKSTPFIQKSK